MNREHRAFSQRIELGIGNDGRDLDHAIVLGTQAGHLHIDPDEVLLVLHVCHLALLTRTI